nr:uncharacterized protein LOC117849721 isoform X2 [Setaria viridis]XP_034587262.1 uncharacterized protein LOC117849722 isoform X2 [Setaria viridis]XP_034587264.1 uncharacterized protein LOC117849723 isoform X2 [Setaria viridis]
MADVSIKGCPLLMFISSNEMREHDKRENIVMPEQLVSQLCLIWELDSGSHPVIKSNLHEEHSSLKQLTPLVDADISQHLQTISGALEQEKDEVYDKETVIKAWLCCHEQRIKLLYGTNIGQQLLLPSTLVPVFIRDGKIVGRYVGSGKGELVGEILRYNGVRVTY